jgi:hypothetical protein
MNWEAIVTTLKLATSTAIVLAFVRIAGELLGCVFQNGDGSSSPKL